MNADIIAQIRNDFKMDRNKEWWLAQTIYYVNIIQTQKSQIKHGEIKNLTHWLHESVNNIDTVDIDLFSDYIISFTRLVVNVGNQGDIKIEEDLDNAFDEAINFFIRNNRSPIDLYLARDTHLSKINNEIKDREMLLNKMLAISNIAPGDRIRAMLALAQYYTAISEYNNAENICLQCQHLLEEHPSEDKYRCRFLTTMGINYFTSFQNHKQAHLLLRQACHFIEQYPKELDVIRATSTAYHYLGRLMEFQGDISEAMKLYIISKEYQDICPEELGATAFIHLRIGELLTHICAFEQARDHLLESHRLFRIMRDRGSGWAQVHLGFAMLETAQGNRKTAEYNLMKALQISRDCGFIRGELLSLGLLILSQIRSFRFISASITFKNIITTAFNKELQENNLRNLFSRAYILLYVLSRKISGIFRVRRRYKDYEEISCPCPIHGIPHNNTD